MPILYKQILSDRESISFIPKAYADDDAAVKAVADFNRILDSAEINGKEVNIIDEIEKLLATISADPGIFVQQAELSYISFKISGSWDLIERTIDNQTETEKSAKKKKGEYSLEELCKLKLEIADDEENITSYSILDMWQGEKFHALISQIRESRKKADAVLEKTSDIRLADRKEDIADLKEYLDSIQELLHYLKPLKADETLARNVQFYSAFDVLYANLAQIIPLYNSIRNYVTKKAGEQPKMKLMFDYSTLAAGWDLNNENDNHCLLFEKEGQYYLGITASKVKIDFSDAPIEPGTTCYRKMIYKQISKPVQDLPNLMVINGKTVRKTGRRENGENKILNELKNKYLPEEINRIRLSGSYLKTSSNFNQIDSQKYLAYYMQRIIEYKGDSFDFEFKKPSEYDSYYDFCQDVDRQCYKIRFQKISENEINALVNDGKLYLFRIYNKDFSVKSTGTPNMHTLYWKALFDPENLKDVVFKLNGEAELFLREPSITKQSGHKIGEKMVNRTDKDGHPIPEKIHDEIYRYVNNGEKGDLPVDVKSYYDKSKIKIVTHELIKDKRFTQRKILFHVPLVINFKQEKEYKKLNNEVKDFLRNNPDVNIIGIDRGERHLIYISLIDQAGNIIKQKSFNTIETVMYNGETKSFNYHKKLDQREKERKEAKKSWCSIGQIKDLKSGFLSQVVHEISKMMIDNNAIVVLEDLNSGFKRRRIKIEKQVYQKFEKALIEKLNYLVFKDKKDNEPGGVLNGYQLTNAFTGFKELSKQTGFLFYVPPSYTSKIDPTTGFVNVFKLKDFTNAESKKEFFSTFESIKYSEEYHAFTFSFDYKKFKTSKECWKSQWTVYSAKERLVSDSKNKQKKVVTYPTEIIFNVLKEKNIVPEDGFDLKLFLASLNPAVKAENAMISKIFTAFRDTLQMRNSSSAEEAEVKDYIQSPVLNKDNCFYDSQEYDANPCLPENADANGAYNIAMKGLYLIQHEFKTPKDKEWFQFVQERNL